MLVKKTVDKACEVYVPSLVKCLTYMLSRMQW